MAEQTKWQKYSDRFERKVVFKLARNMFLVNCAIALLVLCVSVLVFLYSWTPTSEPEPGPRPEVAAAVPITLAQIEKAEQAEQAAAQEEVVEQTEAKESAEAAPAKEAPPEKSPEELLDEKAAPLLLAIRSHFPEKGDFPWGNETKRTCAWKGYYGCAEWKTKVTEYGMKSRLSYSKGELSGADYLTLLSSLKANLEAAKDKPDREPFNTARQTFSLFYEQVEELNQEHREALDAYAMAGAAAQGEYVETLTTKTAWRSLFLYITLGVLGCLAFFALLLALLAVERSATAIRRLTEELYTERTGKLPGSDEPAATQPEPV